MPYSRATAWVDSGRRLQTATISTPGRASSPGMCRWRVLAPAPTNPTRNRWFAMVVLVRRDSLARLQPSATMLPVARSFVPFTGRPFMRQLLAAAVLVALVGFGRAAREDDVVCKAEGMHVCCKSCEKSLTEILGKVDGVSKVSVDRPNKRVTFEAKSDKAASDAHNALLNGGFYCTLTKGDKSSATNTVINLKADTITVKNVHACCGQCVKALKALFTDADVTVMG